MTGPDTISEQNGHSVSNGSPNPIRTSLFELYKIGPGPSSSHTIGPMRAGYEFMERIRTLDDMAKGAATTLSIRLFGSLSATGEGHGTRKAILAGLLGFQPETCLPDVLDGFNDIDQPHSLPLEGCALAVRPSDIVFDAIQHDYPHSNTMVFRLEGRTGTILEHIYYSIGGGSLRWEGWEEPAVADPRYPFGCMEELKGYLRGGDLRLHQLVLANETAITGASEAEIYAGLDRILGVMELGVTRGVETSGYLPGTIGLQRKAPALHARARDHDFQGPGLLLALNAYAMAVSEENAAGHCVVTAPTCGAAGVVPAIAHLLKHHMKATPDELRHGLLAAAAIGFLAKHNASISGAEVGCQGEVGTASAMAAAMLAYARGNRFQITENAAEIALEHHLGLTCDPVRGYVQIPCIERNAMGAVKAYNAYLIASSVDTSLHKVGLDRAIEAMAKTGRDMSTKYKETSLGGLALSVTEC